MTSDATLRRCSALARRSSRASRPTHPASKESLSAPLSGRLKYRSRPSTVTHPSSATHGSPAGRPSAQRPSQRQQQPLTPEGSAACASARLSRHPPERRLSASYGSAATVSRRHRQHGSRRPAQHRRHRRVARPARHLSNTGSITMTHWPMSTHYRPPSRPLPTTESTGHMAERSDTTAERLYPPLSRVLVTLTQREPDHRESAMGGGPGEPRYRRKAAVLVPDVGIRGVIRDAGTRREQQAQALTLPCTAVSAARRETYSSTSTSECRVRQRQRLSRPSAPKPPARPLRTPDMNRPESSTISGTGPGCNRQTAGTHPPMGPHPEHPHPPAPISLNPQPDTGLLCQPAQQATARRRGGEHA